MNRISKWFKNQRLPIQYTAVLTCGILVGVLLMVVVNPGDIRKKALHSFGFSQEPSKLRESQETDGLSPTKTVTEDSDSPGSSTTIVTNPTSSKKNDDDSISNNQTSGGSNSSSPDKENMTSTPPTPPACVWHSYTGDELTSGVRAQIGQLISFDIGSGSQQGYVSAVSYSESNGKKTNIKYGLEKYQNYIPEGNVVSISGYAGFYKVGSDPILISDKPSYCPPQS